MLRRGSDRRLHLIRVTGSRSLRSLVDRWSVLSRHHPILSSHSRKLRLLLQVFELRIARVVQARLPRVSLLASLPFSDRLVPVHHRSKISRAGWIGCAKVGQSSKGRRDGVHLIYRIRTIARWSIVRVWRWICRCSHHRSVMRIADRRMR